MGRCGTFKALYHRHTERPAGIQPAPSALGTLNADGRLQICAVCNSYSVCMHRAPCACYRMGPNGQVEQIGWD